jgi:metal-responsive CopG/Arc/MetJ family transcriptional regulator
MSSKIQRINISFPKQVADELSRLVPSGKRSRLISDATKKELQKMKILKALKKSAGAWTDANHPDLKTIEDICTWVDNLRQFDERRLAKLNSQK